MHLRKAIQLTLVFVAALLGGCASGAGGSGERLDSATVFDAASPDAIVVMGLRASDGGPVHVQAVWDRYDAATRRAVGADGEGVSPTRIWLRAGAAAILDGRGPDERSEIVHAVFRVAAGDYALTRLMGNVERRFRVTNLVGTTLRLRVAPGEIVYAGDYVIGVNRFPLQVVAVNRDERAARAALAVYPKITGELKLIRPDGVPLVR